jgi:hypothetical protein
VAGAGAVGVVAGAGTAAAHQCPRTPGYWANHDWPDTIDDPFTFFGVTMSVAEWQGFLVDPTYGDKGTILAQHLLATVLNFQHRPRSDPECVDRELGDLWGHDVRWVKKRAETWLANSNWPDAQSSWTVTVDGTSLDGEPLKDALDDWNNGRLDGLACDCDGRDDEKGGNGKPHGVANGRRRRLLGLVRPA